jgi:hypothetical protein
MFEIESLQDSGNVQADTSDENIHPLTGSAEHYALCDWFHEGNCKKPEEVLRRVSLLSNFAGFIESQIVGTIIQLTEKYAQIPEQDNCNKPHVPQ